MMEFYQMLLLRKVEEVEFPSRIAAAQHRQQHRDGIGSNLAHRFIGFVPRLLMLCFGKLVDFDPGAQPLPLIYQL